LDERVTQLPQWEHKANNKARNFLLSALSRSEFNQVSHLQTAHEIWTTLANFHEGISQVKARLFETYNREYENFSQQPGESIDDLFSRFQSIANKIRANAKNGALPYDDHEQACKLLFALDRSIWQMKKESIVESAGYETLTTNELYSKLKASEVDSQAQAKMSGPTPKSLALMSGPSG